MMHRSLSRWSLSATATAAAALAFSSLASAAVPEEPDQLVEYISGQMLENKPQAFWNSLPASYQSDVTEIVHLAGSKLDGDIYNATFSLLGKLGRILTEKKEFILNNPQFQQQIDAEIAAKNWDSAASLFQTLTTSDIATVEGLQTLDIGKFCSTTGSELMKQGMAFAQLSGEDPYSKFRDVDAEVVAQKGDMATVKVTYPNATEEAASSEEVILQKIGERWVEKEMADGWDAAMAEAKAGLESITPEANAESKPQLMMFIGMIDGTLSSLLNAETQEQFDASLQSAMGTVMGLVMMGSQMQGQPAN